MTTKAPYRNRLKAHLKETKAPTLGETRKGDPP